MKQSRTSDTDLQSKLAGSVRSYIQASHGKDQLAADEALRWVCTGLEYFLGSLLDQCDRWRGWVDGIIPAIDMLLDDAVKVISPLHLTIRGQAIWGTRAAGPFWIEPFLGSLQIVEAQDALTSYEIGFGNADLGLGQFRCDRHIRRATWYSPEEWLFSFSKGAPTGRP